MSEKQATVPEAVVIDALHALGSLSDYDGRLHQVRNFLVMLAHVKADNSEDPLARAVESEAWRAANRLEVLEEAIDSIRHNLREATPKYQEADKANAVWRAMQDEREAAAAKVAKE